MLVVLFILSFGVFVSLIDRDVNEGDLDLQLGVEMK
jgi:hypothetical protein